jgi:hypothetical protein
MRFITFYSRHCFCFEEQVKTGKNEKKTQKNSETKRTIFDAIERLVQGEIFKYSVRMSQLIWSLGNYELFCHFLVTVRVLIVKRTESFGSKRFKASR